MHKLDLLRCLRSLLLGLGFGLLASATLASVDPFYQSTLSEGTRAFARGDHVKAVKYLRIACFGLLEAPTELAGCLTRLALAEAQSENEAAFLNTFARIVEVEERFRGYSQASLSADERQRFEAFLERWVPVESLESVAAFAALAKRQRATKIAVLNPKERHEELTQRIEREPEEPLWRVMAAELELDREDGSAALEHLSVALQLAPNMAHARCLWGFSQAVLEQCAEARASLATCERAPGKLATAEAVIGCYVEVGDWAKARHWLDQLDPALRERAPLRRLGKTIDRGAAAAMVAETQVEETPATMLEEVSPLPAGEPTPDMELATEGELPIEAQQSLTEAQKLISSTSVHEVKRGFDLARDVADTYRDDPAAQHLTAELAIRLRRWKDAVQYFQRGGEINPENAQRLFFYAIALFETGEEGRAADILERCRDRLQESPFVRSYIAKISR